MTFFHPSPTDPFDSQTAPTSTESASTLLPGLPALVHFYHYDSLTGSGNVIVATGDSLESHPRIMEMVNEAHALRLKMTARRSPSRCEPIILVDMTF